MARVGLKYSVFAPITDEPSQAPIVYGDPLVFNRPIEANVTYESTDNPLYGGDVVAKNDNGITGGSLSLTNTHFMPSERAIMLGHKKKGTGDTEYYVEGANPSPPGGFWYVTTERENGIDKFYGYHIYKTSLALNADNAKTKAGNTDWQTPTLEGAIMGVIVDTDGDVVFRAYNAFDSYAAAKAWVDGLAGVGITPGGEG